MENKPLTTAEIAEHCHVSHRAVLKWIAAGKLKAYRTPGMHARVKNEDFVNFLKKYNFPIPETLAVENAQKRILIVDDDRDLVGLIKRILLLEKGFEVETAFDGFMAGRRFVEFKPDLILLDIKMPFMNGFEVLRMLREDEANNQVKVMTVSGGDEDALKYALTIGANDVLAKPFDYKVLIARIKILLGMTNTSS